MTPPCGLLATSLLLFGIWAAAARADDSYMAALKHSKQDVMDLSVNTDSSRTSRNDFQPSSSSGSASASGVADSSASSSVAFDVPATAYGSPASTYGSPSSDYGTPAGEWVSSSTSYQPASHQQFINSGPPKPVYGPPQAPTYNHGHHPVYVPAAVPTIHQVYYGHSAPPPAVGWEGPRESHWLLDKLKFKLDFFTIGKILLKLIIFKKIVKFIALICLLLFLPKLQSLSGGSVHGDSEKDEDALEERRALDVKYDLSARINETTTFALTAMDAFSRKYPDACAGPLDITCRLGKMMDAVDARYPYQKIVQMYLPKELETNEIAK